MNFFAKKSVLIICVLFSQFTFAGTIKNSVTSETWTCKGEANGYVDNVTITVDRQKNIASGALMDGTMSSRPIKLSVDNNDLTRLAGEIFGHDSREYLVKMPALSNEVLESSEIKTTANIIVYYSGFIDCMGDLSGKEILTCDVSLERTK
jgi:hypothetical protein